MGETTMCTKCACLLLYDQPNSTAHTQKDCGTASRVFPCVTSATSFSGNTSIRCMFRAATDRVNGGFVFLTFMSEASARTQRRLKYCL